MSVLNEVRGILIPEQAKKTPEALKDFMDKTSLEMFGNIIYGTKHAAAYKLGYVTNFLSRLSEAKASSHFDRYVVGLADIMNSMWNSLSEDEIITIMNLLKEHNKEQYFENLLNAWVSKKLSDTTAIMFIKEALDNYKVKSVLWNLLMSMHNTTYRTVQIATEVFNWIHKKKEGFEEIAPRITNNKNFLQHILDLHGDISDTTFYKLTNNNAFMPEMVRKIFLQKDK